MGGLVGGVGAARDEREDGGKGGEGGGKAGGTEPAHQKGGCVGWAEGLRAGGWGSAVMSSHARSDG